MTREKLQSLTTYPLDRHSKEDVVFASAYADSLLDRCPYTTLALYLQERPGMRIHRYLYAWGYEGELAKLIAYILEYRDLHKGTVPFGFLSPTMAEKVGK